MPRGNMRGRINNPRGINQWTKGGGSRQTIGVGGVRYKSSSCARVIGTGKLPTAKQRATAATNAKVAKWEVSDARAKVARRARTKGGSSRPKPMKDPRKQTASEWKATMTRIAPPKTTPRSAAGAARMKMSRDKLAAARVSAASRNARMFGTDPSWYGQ